MTLAIILGGEVICNTVYYSDLMMKLVLTLPIKGISWLDQNVKHIDSVVNYFYISTKGHTGKVGSHQRPLLKTSIRSEVFPSRQWVSALINPKHKNIPDDGARLIKASTNEELPNFLYGII